MKKRILKCSACQGSQLVFGSLKPRYVSTLKFVPEDASLVSWGYPIHAFVCRDCGQVGFRVPIEHLEKLKPAKSSELGLG